MKCEYPGFLLGMGTGLFAGMIIGRMCFSRQRRKTKAGQAMEQVCGKVDQAAHKIQCIIRSK